MWQEDMCRYRVISIMEVTYIFFEEIIKIKRIIIFEDIIKIKRIAISLHIYIYELSRFGIIFYEKIWIRNQQESAFSECQCAK